MHQPQRSALYQKEGGWWFMKELGSELMRVKWPLLFMTSKGEHRFWQLCPSKVHYKTDAACIQCSAGRSNWQQWIWDIICEVYRGTVKLWFPRVPNDDLALCLGHKLKKMGHLDPKITSDLGLTCPAKMCAHIKLLLFMWYTEFRWIGHRREML